MPVILFFLLFFLYAPPLSAQIPTTPQTIKLGSFTPVPSKTPPPSPTFTPAPIPPGGENCRTERVRECKKSCNKPGGRCGTGGTGAALYWCERNVTVCAPANPPPQNPPPQIPVPTTPVANPTANPTTAPAPNEIYDLVNQIRIHCGGRIINHANISCIQNMTFPAGIAQAIKDELWASAYSNSWLQCVGFVRAGAARHNGAPWPRIYGNAIAYASTAIPPGYTFIRKNSGIAMMPHDIVVWYSPSYPTVGHIAYVTRVYSSTRFEVAEANYGCGSGCARTANWDTTNTDLELVGWLRKR